MPGIGKDIKPGDGLPLAPTARGVGPFTGPLVVGHLLARRDQVAVDDPGRHRVQLAGKRGDGRLVEEGHPLADQTLGDQRSSLILQPERHQVTVAEAGAEVQRPPREFQRPLVIGLALQRDHRLEPGQIPVLDPNRLVLKQTLGSVQPSEAQTDLNGRAIVKFVAGRRAVRRAVRPGLRTVQTRGTS